MIVVVIGCSRHSYIYVFRDRTQVTRCHTTPVATRRRPQPHTGGLREAYSLKCNHECVQPPTIRKICHCADTEIQSMYIKCVVVWCVFNSRTLTGEIHLCRSRGRHWRTSQCCAPRPHRNWRTEASLVCLVGPAIFSVYPTVGRSGTPI